LALVSQLAGAERNTGPIETMHNSYDPDELTRDLLRLLARRRPVGVAVGRTTLTAAVSQLRGCSELEAERAVDRLVALGKVLL
jgi:hypothetical protein